MTDVGRQGFGGAAGPAGQIAEDPPAVEECQQRLQAESLPENPWVINMDRK